MFPLDMTASFTTECSRFVLVDGLIDGLIDGLEATLVEVFKEEVLAIMSTC